MPRCKVGERGVHDGHASCNNAHTLRALMHVLNRCMAALRGSALFSAPNVGEERRWGHVYGRETTMVLSKRWWGGAAHAENQRS